MMHFFMRLSGIDIERRLSNTLFGRMEISQFSSLSSSKQQWMPIEYIVYGTLIPFAYWRGVCVARFEKLGNARSSTRETSNGYDSTLFYFSSNHFAWESAGKKSPQIEINAYDR